MQPQKPNFVLLFATTPIQNNFTMNLFDVDMLKQITQTDKLPEQMMFDIARKESIAHLKMFRFVVAFNTLNISIAEVAYGLVFLEHPSESMSDYTLISFDLQDMLTFVTSTHIPLNRTHAIAFMNWCYPILRRYYPELDNDYRKIAIMNTHLFRLERR